MSKYDYDAIIIGAGIGGLVCGCYLTQKGCKTLIIEKHDKPGGYCTSFKRKGFSFDAAVHYIGSVKRGILSRILDELEINKEKLFNQFDPTDKIILPNTVVYIRANPEETVQEFIKSFPSQKKQIKKFFDFILAKDFFSIFLDIKDLSFKEILDAHFQDREIKEAFISLLANMGTAPNMVSAVNAIIFYREFILDPGYYPLGGMQSFADELRRLFESRGGKIILQSSVKKIIIENNTALGVSLDKHNAVSSRFVISNADATETFSRLVEKDASEEYSNLAKLSPSSSCCALFLGLRSQLEEISSECPNIWKINSPNISHDLVHLRESLFKDPLPFGVIYSPSAHDPLACKTTIQILVNAPYESEDFWAEHKRMMSEKMLSLAKDVFPSLRDENIEVLFGATPITFHKYTGNTGGAIYGWEKTLKNLNGKLVPQSSSIKNLFLAGHWTTSGGGGGGVSGVAAIGRSTAQVLLEQMGIKWPWRTFILK